MPDFDGKGFSKEEFSDEERAEMRERGKHYDNNFLSADEFVEQSGLGWIVAIAKGFPAFRNALIFVTILGGAIAAATQLGLI